MNVILLNRDHSLWEGGDRRKVEHTQEALKRLGVRATYTAREKGDYEGDIAHIFHVSFPTAFQFFCNVRRQRLPLVVSTIYSDDRISYRQQEEILAYASRIIFLSQGEIDYVSERLYFDTRKAVIVPNGVSPLFDQPPLAGEFVLCVGRIQKQKNQLFLARACRLLNLRLFCVGQVMDAHYARLVVAEGANLIGNLPQRDLVSWYRKAQVVACVSRHEVQPNCVLEGGMCGANVVLTKNCLSFTSGVPGVWTCLPSLEGIMTALKTAWGTPKTGQSREVFRSWSWERVARELLEVYTRVLSE